MFFPHIFHILRAVFLYIDYIYLQVIGLYFIFLSLLVNSPNEPVCIWLARLFRLNMLRQF